jgi:hypothetical protein
VALANLGAWLTEFGQYPEAEEYPIDALEIRQKLLGDVDPNAADGMTLLADLQLLTDPLAEACDLARRARELAAQAFTPGHWPTACAASAQGAALRQPGRYEEAEPMLVDSFDTLSNDLGAFPVVIVTARQRVIDLYEAADRPALAIPYQSVP